MPSDDTDLLARVTAYLGASVTTAPAEIAKALAAEQALQARCCRIPAAGDTTPAAVEARTVLEEAVCRRAAVNLARRGIPLGMQTTDIGTARVSTKDPEVRRLEAPYRKLPIG